MGTTPMQRGATTPQADERAAGDPPPRAPQKQAGLYFPQTGPAGRLVVRDRCIHTAPDGGGGLVVWPHGYSPRRESGEVLVLDGRGEAVAKVGEEVRMGGGQTTREEAGPTPGPPSPGRRAGTSRSSGRSQACRIGAWVRCGCPGGWSGEEPEEWGRPDFRESLDARFEEWRGFLIGGIRVVLEGSGGPRPGDGGPYGCA